MIRVTIRSRTGNTILGFLGVLYAVSAVALLVWHGMQTRDAAGLIDRAIQVMLVLTVIVGLWFVLTARANLRQPAPGNR